MSKRHESPYPSADDIARRAHELFTAGGRRIALIPEYWRTAERELLRCAANRVLRCHDRSCHAPNPRRSKC